MQVKVFRLVGLCAECGLPSNPVFCSESCKQKYLREYLARAERCNEIPLSQMGIGFHEVKTP